LTNLLLAPHNDDEVLFACWTLLRHQPHVIFCTRAAHDYERREKESEAVMELLGLDWTQLPISAAQPDWEQVEVYLNGWANARPYGDLLDQFKVFAPAHEEYGHEQHNEVASLAARVFGADNVTHYMTYERGHGHSSTWNEVPYEPYWLAVKLRALSLYETQIANPDTRPWFCEYLELREWYA
jgi:LmbE family N-acetylglucosaminyl deacetylase